MARSEALLARSVALSCSVAREVERAWSQTNQVIQDIINHFTEQREEEEEEEEEAGEYQDSNRLEGVRITVCNC